MRSTISLKSVAVMYALGLIWFVSIIGLGVVLVQPMSALYDAIGSESVALETVATTALAILMASSVTVGVALVLRVVSGQKQSADRA